MTNKYALLDSSLFVVQCGSFINPEDIPNPPGLASVAIDDGTFDDITEPSLGRWRYAQNGFEFVPDGHSVDNRWGLAKINRAQAESAGFYYGGNLFDSDAYSQSKISGAVQMASIAVQAGAPYSVEWTLADNTTVALDAQQMIGVGLALAAHINAVHVRSREIRAALVAATTPQEIEAVDITF